MAITQHQRPLAVNLILLVSLLILIVTHQLPLVVSPILLIGSLIPYVQTPKTLRAPLKATFGSGGGSTLNSHQIRILWGLS